MIDTPDAPPGDVEGGAVSGHDENGSTEPQNPIEASLGEVAGDEAAATEVREAAAEAPEEAAAEAPEAAAEVPDAAAAEVPEEVPEEAAAEVPDAAAAEVPEEVVAEAIDDDEMPDVAPQAPAAPEAEDIAVLDLRAEVDELSRSLAATQRRADELATVARKQTEMADELHADNRRLREGEIREAVAPLVRGLARLADDLGRMRSAAEASEDLAYLEGRVEELLHDAGVLTVQAQIGEPFDPQRHQATGSATTADSALNRTIAEVRRTGLRRDDGRMLRPVDVVVFRYVAPPAPEAQPDTEEVT